MIDEKIQRVFDRAHDRNRDEFERSGREITLVDRVVADHDERGDPIPDETRRTVMGELQRDGDQIDRVAAGIYTDVSILVFLSDEVTVYEGDESESRMPSKVEVDGESYIVRLVFDRGNGTQMVVCE